MWANLGQFTTLDVLNCDQLGKKTHSGEIQFRGNGYIKPKTHFSIVLELEAFSRKLLKN